MIRDLHVQPGAKRSQFAGEHGKANEALIQFLADYFGVPKRSVRIVSGLKSRRKRVAVEGAEWKTTSKA